MLHKLKKIDVPIVVILLCFMAISTALVYSATLTGNAELTFDPKKLALIYVVSLLGFTAAMIVDYRVLTKVAYYLYGVGIVLLIAVYFLGVNLNGARGWFRLGFGLDFQPVELVKIILIVTLASFMAKRRGETLQLARDVVPVGLLAALPIGLVVIQPDIGNAIILCVILLGMFWIGNIRLSYVLIGSTVFIGSAALFLYLFKHYYDPLKAYLEAKDITTHWMPRILTLIDPSSASSNARYHVDNAIRAIGSGSLLGEKYLQGSSVHSNFIPVVYTDSIFVVVGEEFGFVGSSALLLMYFVLIYRMILISLHCKNYSGSYIVVGIVSMLVYQIFQNIGMMIGIMPLTGITLPFISYGGTSLLINMIAMGLVMSIKLHDDMLLDED
ncbi:FtsW/RodA/SpoVE family cell cycle protein [Paenibacillus mucilaginosus]|uniref:Cell cycle protein n=3 Tax=Paenibacillus mucilaginosus TaxID=61624 RepID=H6NQH9_9BACL|nr:FtsW/RodA/SpoVE family cell cycle protein [Paenibacillus mucilaginosus]AEI44964.1 cell cycle protein [Paenibacillus mucilaginosus KNP414]AFC32703.1 cell cycle protein [Paenibacillus mucilaginosus 3016]AFH65036.1 cell cycle protein [Paenibacillus mucilaginosus K02]MCG7213126.1 rod shape-determining protein RodA [Paenibacillus mucilaginosus]WDM26472.1 rod shape-determining protein RodA [Paenibacillus mucilaginosus]